MKDLLALKHWLSTSVSMEGGLLIIGNGFDLDMGLHTRYSEFWDSDRWKEIKNTCPEQYLITSLERYRITNHWFDLESGLQDGAAKLLKKLNGSFDNSNYYDSFQILKSELKSYIKNQQESFEPNTNSVAEQIMHAIDSNKSLKSIYTFNYTDIKDISKRFHVTELPPVNYIHGSLYPNDDIILGIEVEDFLSIPSQLTFLIKSNSPYYHSSNLLDDLEMSENIIFFGHSINGMDFPYFKDFFELLVSLPQKSHKKKDVTIITYDMESEMQIKDNFRRNGIDVRSLYNKVALDFILTKEVYNGNEVELRKLENLKGMMG